MLPGIMAVVVPVIVGVVLETIKKIESQMLVRNYTGFLNNKGSNMSNSFLGY